MHNRSMIYGYARVSSNGQDLAQQLAQLDAAGCTKIYREKVSAATAERPQLKRAIGALAAGDVLMVTATDRLARNTRDLLNILHAVKEAGAGFRSIAEPMVDTTRSEEQTSELKSLMRISYAVFCLKKKKTKHET